MRAAAQAVLPQQGIPGWDYVLVARRGATAHGRFSSLLSDLSGAVREVHRPRRAKRSERSCHSRSSIDGQSAQP